MGEGQFKFKLNLWLILFFTIFWSSFAETRSLNSEDRLRIARAWAPAIYQDVTGTYRDEKTGFDPVDSIVGVFFDQNADLRDNGENVFRLSQERKETLMKNVPVFYSMIESSTHLYLNYTIYHAIDANAEGHVHDTENIFLTIQKDGSANGKLAFAISNAHGFPMIYAEDAATEEHLRSRISMGISSKMLKYIDRASGRQHLAAGLESIERSEENSKSLKFFSSTRSHAIYKWNSNAFRRSSEEKKLAKGIYYYPISCEECRSDSMQDFAETSVPYLLLDFDDWMERLKDSKGNYDVKIFAELQPEDNSDGDGGDKSGTQDDDDDDIYWGARYQIKSGLPRDLAPGWGEDRPSANLFFTTRFKTKYPLAHPAALHRFLMGAAEDSRSISDEYLFNPYVEEKWVRPSPRKFLIADAGNLSTDHTFFSWVNYFIP